MNNAFQELFCDCYNYYFVVPIFFQPSSSNLTSVSDFLYFPECFSTTPREKARQAQWNKPFYSAVGYRSICRGGKKKDSKHVRIFFFPRAHQSTKCLVAALHSGLLRPIMEEINMKCNGGFLPVIIFM